MPPVADRRGDDEPEGGGLWELRLGRVGCFAVAKTKQVLATVSAWGRGCVVSLCVLRGWWVGMRSLALVLGWFSSQMFSLGRKAELGLLPC